MKKKIIVVTIAGVITVNSVICSFDPEVKEELHIHKKTDQVQNYRVSSTYASPVSGELTSVSASDFTWY